MYIEIISANWNIHELEYSIHISESLNTFIVDSRIYSHHLNLFFTPKKKKKKKLIFIYYFFFEN